MGRTFLGTARVTSLLLGLGLLIGQAAPSQAQEKPKAPPAGGDTPPAAGNAGEAGGGQVGGTVGPQGGAAGGGKGGPEMGGTVGPKGRGGPGGGNGASEGGSGEGMRAPGGGPGATTRSKKEYTSAAKGAESFLNAVKEKNLEDLSESVALRSQFEAKPTKQAMFKSILDKNSDPSDIDTLAREFEGYSVMGQNTAKSTGSIGIIVGKTVKTDTYTRTLLMRHEKAGWKVQDYTGERDFKTATNGPRRKR